MVCPRDGLLHWGLLSDRGASSSTESACDAAFTHGLRAQRGRNDELFDVLLPEF
jgi:hypothetical protein